MSDVKISVIVPIYNAEKYLQVCVESLLRQTYQNIELIFVDDGSKDKCGAYLDTLTDPRCKIIHKENGGVQSARRVGISNATGNYITFVDADDYLAKTAYEECFKAIEKFNPSMCVFHYKSVYTDTFFKRQPEVETTSDQLYSHIEKEDLYDNAFAGYGLNGPLWNKVWKREIIDQIDFRDDFQITEDACYVWDSLKYTNNVVIINKRLYYYRHISSSMTRNSNVAKYMAAGESWNYLQAEAEKMNSKSLTGICCSKISWYMRAAMAIVKSREDQTDNKRIVLEKLGEVKEYYSYLGKKDRVLYDPLQKSWGRFGVTVRLWNIAAWFDQKLKIFKEKLSN